MDNFIKSAQDRLNRMEDKCDMAKTSGNKSMWKRWYNCKRGYKLALRDMGYRVYYENIDVETGKCRYIVSEVEIPELADMEVQ